MNELKYTEQSLSLNEIQNMQGKVIIEFGENWCPICQNAQPNIIEALENFEDINRLMIIDGKGKRLGRQFKVKLWPTLVLIEDGNIKGNLVRPETSAHVKSWLDSLIK